MLLLAILLDVLSPESHPARADAPPAARGTPSAPPEKAARWSIEEIFGALRVVETGGSKSGGRQSTGDGGRAIGPFQIHRDYWVDSKVPGRFEDCRDLEYARKVVLSYWRRYCPKALDALDAETLARIHNGGPAGLQKDSTKAFWRKVERELVDRRRRSA